MSSHINTSDGYSPPETAIEATPETTPMKENLRSSVHTVPASSTIPRAMWNSSQPSSPARKDPTKFSYPSAGGQADSAAAATRLLRMVGDRIALQQQGSSNCNFEQQVASPAEMDASQEDQEVRVINSRPMAIKGAEKGLDDTLTNIDFENEGSPCVDGGLHISESRSVIEFARKFNRYRIASIGLEGENLAASFSVGTPPDAQNVVRNGARNGRLRRFNTWPRITHSTADFRSLNASSGAEHSTPNREKLKQSQKLFQQIRKDLSGKLVGGAQDKAVQTVPSYHQPYDRMISELFKEELRLRDSVTTGQAGKVVLSPAQLLDKLIESCSRRRQNADTNTSEQEYQESLNLLHLQLQYERYRREVHADRNRRLLGTSRQIHQYEQNLNTLRDQVAVLSQDNGHLTKLLNEARYSFNMSEEALTQELHLWKQKCTAEQEENKRLQANIEGLKAQLVDAGKTKRENHLELESARGELFDVKNELRQMMLQVGWSCHKLKISLSLSFSLSYIEELLNFSSVVR